MSAFLLALMVNARHLFYGISMLKKYEHTGWKKFYLIYGMCDESFSINCTVTPPEDVDRGWFMFFVTLLNHFYWVCGATAGSLLGYVIHFDTTGIDFVMTALFVVMFLGQWEEHPDHRPALIGLIIPTICLFIFGSQSFIIPCTAQMEEKHLVIHHRRNYIVYDPCAKDIVILQIHSLSFPVRLLAICLATYTPLAEA